MRLAVSRRRAYTNISDAITVKDVAVRGMSCAVNEVALSHREHAENGKSQLAWMSIPYTKDAPNESPCSLSRPW